MVRRRAVEPGSLVMFGDIAPFFRTVIASLVYSLIGIAMFGLCFALIRAVTPFSIRKEIEEDHNTALAIVIGSVIIGMSLIIAAAIHG
jgi:putative membrane protein